MDDLPGSEAAKAPVVPLGAAYFPLDRVAPTRSFAFLVVPGFTLLAFSSAVEPLRIANQLSQKPLYRWRVLSTDGAPVTSSSGIAVCVDDTLGPLPRETGLFVCSGNPATAAAHPAVVAALQRHVRFGGTVGGICTGAVALAHAGLLHGRSFTMHWENQPAFREAFPELEPSGRRFECATPVMTCGGGAAATDMMIAEVERDHGPEFAAVVSDMCLRKIVVGAEPEQRSSLAAQIRSRNPGLLAVVKLMKSHLEDPLSMDELAEVAGYSRRHIERIFLSILGETPARYYQGLRLDLGRNLLSTTDLSLIEVATACGFISVAHFSKSFRARFGIAPTAFDRTISVTRRRRRQK